MATWKWEWLHLGKIPGWQQCSAPTARYHWLVTFMGTSPWRWGRFFLYCSCTCVCVCSPRAANNFLSWKSINYVQPSLYFGRTKQKCGRPFIITVFTCTYYLVKKICPGIMSDQRDFDRLGPILVGHCPMTDTYLQLCTHYILLNSLLWLGGTFSTLKDTENVHIKLPLVVLYFALWFVLSQTVRHYFERQPVDTKPKPYYLHVLSPMCVLFILMFTFFLLLTRDDCIYVWPT